MRCFKPWNGNALGSKFEGIDFSQIPVERLTPDILNLGQEFRCLGREFVTYCKQGRIKREADAHICHCWAIRSRDSDVLRSEACD
jgi:hypothetical protein